MKRGTQSDRPPKPPPGGWRSPEAIWSVNRKHVRVLERMLRHRLGRFAAGEQSDFVKAEIGALNAAIAELKDLLDERNQ